MKLLEWVGNSLLGHVVAVEVAVSLPMFLLLSALNYSLGLLTVESAIRAAIFWFAIGAAGAIVVWRAVSLPFARRRKK